MRAGSLYHSEYLKYFKVNDLRIYINPNMHGVLQIVQSMAHKRDRRIHIFITNEMIIDKDIFREILEAFFQDKYDVPTVTIHLPYDIKEAKKILREKVIPTLKTEYVPRISIYNEHGPIRFYVDSDVRKRWLNFVWSKDELLVNYELNEYKTYRAEG